MNYTPLSHLTDDELLYRASTVSEPTDMEIELALRLELALQQLEDEADHTSTVDEVLKALDEKNL